MCDWGTLAVCAQHHWLGAAASHRHCAPLAAAQVGGWVKWGGRAWVVCAREGACVCAHTHSHAAPACVWSPVCTNSCAGARTLRALSHAHGCVCEHPFAHGPVCARERYTRRERSQTRASHTARARETGAGGTAARPPTHMSAHTHSQSCARTCAHMRTHTLSTARTATNAHTGRAGGVLLFAATVGPRPGVRACGYPQLGTVGWRRAGGNSTGPACVIRRGQVCVTRRRDECCAERRRGAFALHTHTDTLHRAPLPLHRTHRHLYERRSVCRNPQ